MQFVADGQDTDSKRVSLAPAIEGVLWISHLVPFQRSASMAPVSLLTSE
jgi:hypothetical protein